MYISSKKNVEPKTGKKRQVPINSRMDKLYNTHAMKFYTTMKMNEILLHIIKWVNVTNIMLNERNQIQKNMDEPSYTIGENVNWCNHCGKQNRGLSKKLKTELIYDSAISLLDVFPENTKTLI